MFKKASGYDSIAEPEIIAGLDLGTSKITVVAAEKESDSTEAQIIGVGQAPSNGIRKGLIVNLEQAVRSVKQAVSDAQNMIGQDITSVAVAFGGGDVTSVRTRGMVSLGRTPRTVTSLDIERAIEAAQADVAIPANQCILHTIPIEYSLDGSEGIDDPLGMTAIRLDIQLQSVIVPTSTVQNVLNCVEKAGLNVDAFVIKPLASALGVLTPDEALAGVAVVDIGGGTTSVAVFSDGRPKHLALISVGGDHITNDVGSILKLPLNKAEELKQNVDIFSGSHEKDVIDFVYNDRKYSVSAGELSEIIKCRIEETFDVLVRPEIKAAEVSMLPAGIILTGGVSKMEGIDSFVTELMDLPTRVAMPLDASKMPPERNTQEYSAAAGVIRFLSDKARDPFRYIGNPAITDRRFDASSRQTLVPSDKDKVKIEQTKIFNPIKGITDALKDLF